MQEFPYFDQTSEIVAILKTEEKWESANWAGTGILIREWKRDPFP